MNRITTFIIIAMTAVCAAAQHRTLRQQNFPAALPKTDENTEWQRDIYREVSVYDDANAGLYCPSELTASRQGLFTTVFNLAVEQRIPIYRYAIDGNETFNEAGRADIRDVLRNHRIFFTEQNGQISIQEEDIPASDVVLYYIKEGVYYDYSNSSFRVRVLALCPVLVEEGEFSLEPTRYPLFWVEYADIEPYMDGLNIIPDYTNTAMVMRMSDYFTLNRYKGSIYKVSNPFGRTLRQTAPTDSAYAAAQQQVEREIQRLTRTTYNTYYTEVKPVEEPVKKKRKKEKPVNTEQAGEPDEQKTPAAENKRNRLHLIK